MIIGRRLRFSGLAFSAGLSSCGFLTAIALFCTPMAANAQGYPSGIRSGTNGSAPAAASPAPRPGAIPVTAPSTGSVGNRNMGTGATQQPQGAMGMTPQFQKELVLPRQ